MSIQLISLFRWLLVLSLLILPVTARAQFDAATVFGVVKDDSGAAVPGVTVTLTNLATGIRATAMRSWRSD